MKKLPVPVTLGIQSWAEEDRPREKLLLKGISTLSDAELLAILLGSGTVSLSAVDVGRIILTSVDQDLNRLAKLSVKDLQKFKGVGEAKAITLVSAMELGRRRKEQEPEKKVQVTCSKDSFLALRNELMDLPYEEFWLLVLNRANLVVKKQRISQGGVAGTVADLKILFKIALEHLASSIIIVHNHPSGQLNPSQADIQLTRQIREAGKVLDIPLLDHLIISQDKYYSFADEGAL